jgi:hypothetical protein
MAIACLRLFTFRPERPLLSVPRFISCMARSTLRPLALLYFLAIGVPPSRMSDLVDLDARFGRLESDTHAASLSVVEILLDVVPYRAFLFLDVMFDKLF